VQEPGLVDVQKFGGIDVHKHVFCFAVKFGSQDNADGDDTKIKRLNNERQLKLQIGAETYLCTIWVDKKNF